MELSWWDLHQMKRTEELLTLCVREMPLLGNILLNIECNAGFWFGRSGYFDDGDEDNNYENGSADDDGEIDEDRKCMAVMTDIA